MKKKLKRRITLCDPMDCSLPCCSPWNFPGKNTGVGCHFLLQGICPTHGSNPRLSPALTLQTHRIRVRVGPDNLSFHQAPLWILLSARALAHVPLVRTCRSLESWAVSGLGHVAAAAAKSRQSCQTLCNPIDGSPPGCPVPGILQARTLEWVAISFSNA